MKFYKGCKFKKSFLIDDEAIKLFAKVSQDYNPVHMNDDYAQRTMFKKRIAHGMLLGSHISSVLGNYFPGNGTVYLNQTMSFLNPVFIDDTVEIEIEVKDITQKGWLTLSTNCYVNNTIVLEGSSLVIPPKD